MEQLLANENPIKQKPKTHSQNTNKYLQKNVWIMHASQYLIRREKTSEHGKDWQSYMTSTWFTNIKNRHEFITLFNAEYGNNKAK